MNKIETLDTYKGYEYVIIATEMGHRCGYIGIDEGHELFGLDHDEDEVNGTYSIHGGFTYSNNLGQYYSDLTKSWYFGFDCAHYDDAKDISIMCDEYKALHKITLQFNEEHISSAVIKTNEYCVNECKNFIDQLEANKK